MSNLSAHEVVLNKIFSSDYEFIIPEYQRPYAWETEQVQELLDDLIDASESDPSEPYFLGSVVLVKGKSSPEAQVIDGQQRLTTLSILLSVLRDLSDDQQLRGQLDLMVRQPEDIIMNLQPKPRLSLRPRDRDFFSRYVQAAGSIKSLLALSPDDLVTDSQRAIRANARVLHEALKSWNGGQILRLVQMLAGRTFLVAVSTADLDSAHRIFGVMNSRGLDLSPADIFKSKVIGALDGAQTSFYAEKWENAEELIGREDFADLFLHIRLIESKQRARLGLLKEFPEQVLDAYLEGDPRTFVDNVVVPYSKAYEVIRDQTFSSTSGADEVNAWFKRLEQLDNNDWRSVALWAVRKNPNDPSWLSAFMRRLERLAASLFIRREWTTPRVSRYIELLKQLDSGAYDLDAPSFELSTEERAETLAGIDGHLYLSKKTRKYVLLRLDESLANSPGASYTHSVITVEHVLPQAPRSDSEWLRSFTEEQRSEWTHRLANLLLLNQVKNSEAQNFDFAAKKSKYFSGKNGVAVFALTSQVLGYDHWTPELLAVRQRELTGVLARQWELV